MKLQVKVTFVVLFLGILGIFGLFDPKDAFAVNQTTFQITFANGGDAQSWVDYNIFEDKTSPFGQYNSGDLVLYYTGNSPDLGFGEWLSVPAYSSVTVTLGPKMDYLPSSAVYVAYLPWKYENWDPRDVGCEDPVASFTPKDVDSSRGANDIHAVVGTSVSYSCWVPQPPPPPPPPPGIPTPVNFKLGPLPSCKNYGEAYQVDVSFDTSGDATYGEMEVNPFDPPADAGAYAPPGFYYPSGTTFRVAISSLFPGGTYTWWAQVGNTSGASGWVQGQSWNVPVCNTAPIGWLDAADCSSFSGWAYDPDAPNTAISIHFYRDGPAGSGVWVGSTTAIIYRSDVGWRGFVFATPAGLKDGQNHSIYAYGIDTQGGANPLLSGAPKTFNCPVPEGWLDTADCSSFSGWAYDPDAPNTAISIHFYSVDPAGSWSFVGSTTANIYRSDVGWRGFVFATPAGLKDGQNHSIYAYGIDTQGGHNPLLSGSPKTFNFNCPDLVITSLTTDKSLYLQGETVNVTITVQNQGSPTATGFVTAYRDATNIQTDADCEGDGYTQIFPTSGTSTLAAGASSTFNGSFVIPSARADGRYRIYAMVDYFCLVNESNEFNNLRSKYYDVGVIPGPEKLSVTTACNALNNNVEVTFRWEDPSGDPGLWLDVNNQAWTGPDGPAPWSTKTLAANVDKFTWSAAAPMDSGPFLVPQNSTTYWWRLKAFNAVGESNHVYDQYPNTDSTTPPGVSFTTPACPQFDLSASFVGGSWNKNPPTYKAGETATAVVMVTNISPPANVTGPATTLGLWKGQSGEVPIANCPSSPQSTPPIAYTKDKNNNDIGVLPPGNIQEVNIIFNVGQNAGQFTANAYVIPSCVTTAGPDSNWANNSTSGSGNISFTYTVSVDAWFETTGGDVGSKRSISVSQDPPGPPNPRFQSDYLLVGNSLAPNVTSQKWRITDYKKPLMTGTPYAYLAERFRQTAGTGSKICQISAGWSAGYNYCDESEAAFNSGNGPNGHSVFFIDGNFTIKNNLTLSSQYSAIFIVKGDITVNTAVTRIDGVYIAGGTFTTTDSAGGVSGSQLVINGAVYGTNVNLSRKLGGPSCVGLCNNTADPAEKIVYDPKYLIALNDLLGSPGVSWKEVAP